MLLTKRHIFKLQDENTKLNVKKENDASEENEDGEEKKDPEKSLEDISEKPTVVCSFTIFVYLCVISSLSSYANSVESVVVSNVELESDIQLCQ